MSEPNDRDKTNPRWPLDLTGDSRDRLRVKTPPPGVRAQTAAPEVEIDDEVTGNVTGLALAEARAKRPTDKRFAHIEDRIDGNTADIKELTATVGTMATGLADVSGQLKILPKLVDAINQSVTRVEARDHVVFTGQMELDTASRKATLADVADAKRTRRALIAKAVGGVAALLTSGAALHWLMEKL